jgi:hypothetical protein
MCRAGFESSAYEERMMSTTRVCCFSCDSSNQHVLAMDHAHDCSRIWVETTSICKGHLSTRCHHNLRKINLSIKLAFLLPSIYCCLAIWSSVIRHFPIQQRLDRILQKVFSKEEQLGGDVHEWAKVFEVTRCHS